MSVNTGPSDEVTDEAPKVQTHGGWGQNSPVKSPALQPSADKDRMTRRYSVEKLNDPTGKHAECRYFVLDPQHDPHSVAALRAYADAVGGPLADDLRRWVRSLNWCSNCTEIRGHRGSCGTPVARGADGGAEGMDEVGRAQWVTAFADALGTSSKLPHSADRRAVLKIGWALLASDWLAHTKVKMGEQIAQTIGSTPLPATEEARSDEFLSGVLWAQSIALTAARQALASPVASRGGDS